MDQPFGALQLSWNADEVVLKYFLILVWRWFSYRQMKGVPCTCSKGEINLKFHLARLDLLRHLSTLQDFLLNHWRTRAAAPGFIWGFDYVFANLLQRKPVKSSLVYSLSIGNLQHRWPYGGISETKKGAEVSCLLVVGVLAGLGCLLWEQIIWWTQLQSVQKLWHRRCVFSASYDAQKLLPRHWDTQWILSAPVSTHCYSVSGLEGPCLGAAWNKLSHVYIAVLSIYSSESR